MPPQQPVSNYSHQIPPTPHHAMNMPQNQAINYNTHQFPFRPESRPQSTQLRSPVEGPSSEEETQQREFNLQPRVEQLSSVNSAATAGSTSRELRELISEQDLVKNRHPHVHFAVDESSDTTGTDNNIPDDMKIVYGAHMPARGSMCPGYHRSILIRSMTPQTRSRVRPASYSVSPGRSKSKSRSRSGSRSHKGSRNRSRGRSLSRSRISRMASSQGKGQHWHFSPSSRSRSRTHSSKHKHKVSPSTKTRTPPSAQSRTPTSQQRPRSVPHQLPSPTPLAPSPPITEISFYHHTNQPSV